MSDFVQPDLPIFECEDTGTHWRFKCPACGEYHYHSRNRGRRISHCAKKPNPYPHGYILVESPKSVVSGVQRRPQNGNIYLIQHGESRIYKIGWTQSDVQARLSPLQTGSPVELKLVCTFPAKSQEIERKLHRIFDRRRRSGEWFELTDVEIANLRSSRWRKKNL